MFVARRRFLFFSSENGFGNALAPHLGEVLWCYDVVVNGLKDYMGVSTSERPRAKNCCEGWTQ